MGAGPGRCLFSKLARMTGGWAAVLLLTACGPLVLYEGELPVGTSLLEGANSPAFARRGPLPGRPDYLQTIKYIDDGMRYIDPLTQFFISPAGEMCFRTKPNYPQVIYETRYRIWCIHPQTVDRVDAVTNDITRINEVHVWCQRAYPQCAHSLNEPGWIANSIAASTVDYRKERDALEDLVDLMGGKTRFARSPGVEASEGPPPTTKSSGAKTRRGTRR
jgi:hypothetical protein